MQRTVVVPADLSAGALEEFKNWLGISRPNEDQVLVDLLKSSLAICEAFIGQMPLEQTIEERLAPTAGSHALISQPVKALVGIESTDAYQSRSVLQSEEFDFSLGSNGKACIDFHQAIDADAIVTTVRAGIASTWADIPKPLKQGIIRLAAYHYRDRDSASNPAPPASVAALWRPWRMICLS